MNTKQISLGILSFVLLFGCGENKQQEETQEVKNASAKTVEAPKVKDTTQKSDIDELAQFKFDKILANLPSPLEILNDLNKSKVSFNKQLLVDSKKFQSANSSSHKALFMGAYSIDMSYVINYDQSQEALKYLSGVKKISDDLGISKYYDKQFYERFEKNLAHKDSLMTMVNSAYSLTDKYLRGNEQLKISNYILVGSWVQSLYVATQSIKDAVRDETNSPVYTRIWHQRLYLKEILEAIEKFKDDEHFKKTIPSLKEVQKICQDAKEDSDLQQAQTKIIAEKIEKIRKEIF